MGCVLSSVDRPALNSRFFDVYNIDDRGQERNPGKIEVADQDLVLYQLGKDPIRWPLRSLRRYGFDAELFSFESGRRCVTGPGIYAFKCHRAEALFNVLQQSIIRAGQQEINRNHVMSDGASVNVPVSSSEWISFQHLPSNLAIDSTTSGVVPAVNNYVNQSPVSLNHDYINHTSAKKTPVNRVMLDNKTHAQTTGCCSIKYAELKLQESTCEKPDANNDDDAEVFTSSSLLPAGSNSYFRYAYVNLPLPFDGTTSGSESVTREREYMNIGGGHFQNRRSAAVTYAQLDLFGDGPIDTNQIPTRRSSMGIGAPLEVEISRTKSDAYASIDFQRTRALSSKVEDELGEGYRKTRHNSTIEKFPGVG